MIETIANALVYILFAVAAGSLVWYPVELFRNGNRYRREE